MFEDETEEELKRANVLFQQEQSIRKKYRLEDYDIAKAIPPSQQKEPTYDIKNILEQHRNVPFVNRMFKSDAPRIVNPDGSVSSHLLGWGEQDGKYYVYPSLVEQNGKLIRPKDPFRYALGTKNFIELADKKAAIELAGGAWKKQKNLIYDRTKAMAPSYQPEKPVYDIEKSIAPVYKTEEPDELKIEKPSFWQGIKETYERYPYEVPYPLPTPLKPFERMSQASVRLTQPSYWKEAIPKFWNQFKEFATEFPEMLYKTGLVKMPIHGLAKARELERRGIVGPEVVSAMMKKPGVDIKQIGITLKEFALWLPKTVGYFVQDPVGFIEQKPLDAAFLASMVLGKGVLKKGKKGEPPKLELETIGELTDRLLAPVEFGIDPTLMLAAERKVISVLDPARMLAGKQKAMYKGEWGKRFAEAEAVGKKIPGEKGFYAEKAKLKGEMQRVEFESIRNKLTQTELDAMFQKVADSPALTYPESVAARDGLEVLFGEPGGAVPQPSQITLLNRVFSKEFIETIMSKRDPWTKAKEVMLEAASVPRAMMASFDLSFGFRQGIFLAVRYPKEFWPAFAKQFKYFGSEKAYRALMEDIVSKKNYPLARKGRLALTEMDATLGLREEAFLGGRLAEKIPVIGLGIRASNRAYTGFANKLRFDVFDKMVEGARKMGHNPAKDDFLLSSITDFVNTASGRGSIGAFEKVAVTLNALIFSPRLVGSRLKLLWPGYYIKLHPFVRRQALQSLFANIGTGITVLGLAKLAGAEVGGNWFSADFGKIKIGDTRIDIWGGFQPYVRTAAQAIWGKTVSTTTGKVTKTGEGYKPLTRPAIVWRGAKYKMSPVASFAFGLLEGKGTDYEKFEVGEEVAKRFIPMVIQDIIDLAKEDPDLLPLGALGIFGVGLQTYESKKKKGYWK